MSAFKPIGRRALRRCLQATTYGTVQSQRLSSKSANLSIAKLLATPADGAEREVFGFIRSIRKQKTRAFASIGDGSSLGPLQAMLTPEQAQSLTTGAAVRLTGQWMASPNNKAQSCELHVKDVALLGASDPATFPLQKKYQTAEYLRTMPHMRVRLPFNSALLRLRSQSIANLVDFFAKRDFVQTHPPIITSSDCEGAGEVFSVETEPPADVKSNPANAEDHHHAFFRTAKYLTVSSQLHLEALAQSVGKVWTLSPTFRAEMSDTARHLSEFYMLEAEQCFVDKVSSIMDLTEDMLRHMVTKTYNTKLGQEIISGNRTGTKADAESQKLSEDLEARWQGIMRGPWPRITYTEAIGLLQNSAYEFEHEPVWGAGLQAEHERYIAGNIGDGGPVFVTKYPKSIKPFYMLPSEDSPAQGETVDCFDLLVPEFCEVAGGSMREHRLPELISSMYKQGLVAHDFDPANPEESLTEEALGAMKWYVDLRTWGTVPHGGFGVGFDRMLGYLAGVPNIREVVAFPRWVGRCEC